MIVVVALLAISPWLFSLGNRRKINFINSFEFPKGLLEKLQGKYEKLSPSDILLVCDGLRQFFRCYIKSRCLHISMPSKVVDELWHEFILYTRDYQQFCDAAFDTFFHHQPAISLDHSTADQLGNQGLRRLWLYACKDEGMSPQNPSELPLLFSLDADLDIEGGFKFSI